MLKLFASLLLSISFYNSSAQKSNKKVLVFTKTAGYHHASIPAGIAAIQKMGSTNGYAVDTTTNSAGFTTRI